MPHPPDDYLKQFDPMRDNTDQIYENADSYAARMQAGPLPHWPKELLVEWLYRHERYPFRYAFLGFENLSFRSEVWPLASIPGREAFFHPGGFCKFNGVMEYAKQGNWIAKYMLEHGTWNTPVVLLENSDASIQFPSIQFLNGSMKSPFHLLEGHRRLSFLNGLRDIGKAGREHIVWIATWNGRYAT